MLSTDISEEVSAPDVLEFDYQVRSSENYFKEFNDMDKTQGTLIPQTLQNEVRMQESSTRNGLARKELSSLRCFLLHQVRFALIAKSQFPNDLEVPWKSQSSSRRAV